MIEKIEAEDIRRRDIEIRLEGYKEEYQRYLKMADALAQYNGNAEEAIKHYVNYKGELYATVRQFNKTLNKFKTRGRASPINTYYQDYPDADSGAVLVGKQSPGYLLGAQWKRLPNGLSFMHPFLQPIPSNGYIVENNGVVPDINIELNRKSLLEGKDSQVEAAIEYILKSSE